MQRNGLSTVHPRKAAAEQLSPELANSMATPRSNAIAAHAARGDAQAVNKL